jgi:hypothetical protein
MSTHHHIIAGRPAATLRAFLFFLIAYRLLRGSTSSVGNLLVDVVNEEESASTSERFGWQIFTEEEWRPSAESNKQLR